MARLYAEMALRSVGAKRRTEPAGALAGMRSSRSSAAVDRFLARRAAARHRTMPPPPSTQAPARGRTAPGERQHAGQSLARRAGRRRQQQPGLRQRRRHAARALRRRSACATSRLLVVAGDVPAQRCRARRNVATALRDAGRRGLPRLHDQPRRRARLLPAARPAAAHAGRARPGAEPRAAARVPTVVIVSACHSGTFINDADAPAQPHHPDRGRDRPHELRLRRRRRLHLLRPVLPAAARRRVDLARARPGDADLRRDARAPARRRESRPQLSSARRRQLFVGSGQSREPPAARAHVELDAAR